MFPQYLFGAFRTRKALLGGVIGKEQMHILTVVGARPQFIKASALSRRLRNFSEICETIVHTGQHYDQAMSAQFFQELDIPEPICNLEVGSDRHGAQTGAIMAKLEVLLPSLNPDLILVYGDTNSTLAAALVAAKAGVQLAHVEAGLRSFRRSMPEEVNRIVTDHLSNHLFCSSHASVTQLEKEGISKGVHMVGDIMFDSFLFSSSTTEAMNAAAYYGLRPKDYILATIHRAENTDDRTRLESIFEALRMVSVHCPVILPLHPRTRNILTASQIEVPPSIRIITPCSYGSMVGLTMSAAIVATDSGGVQKEAYFAGVPCVTLRDETEWTETLEFGWNRLAPPGISKYIYHALIDALGMAGTGNPPPLYGNGDAAGSILDILRHLN